MRQASISPSQSRRDDIVWTYSGVRPLYDDGASKAQEATRDYVLKADRSGGAPIVNIFGGKITTYRRLAESTLDKIEGLLGARAEAWTATAALPGGDFVATAFDAEVDEAQESLRFPRSASGAAAHPALRHAGRTSCSASPDRWPISAAASAPISMRRKFAI